MQHVKFPTHKLGNTLDVVISRDDVGVNNLRPDSLVKSDHFSVLFDLSSSRPGLPRETREYRCWRKVDLDAFQADLQTAFSDFDACNLSTAIDSYNSFITSIADKHAPLKKRQVTIHPDAEWYNDELKVEKQKRRKLERQARRTKLRVHWELHDQQRDHYNLLLERAQTKFYQETIRDAPSSKDQWRTLNRLLGKSGATPLPTHDSPQKLCNDFNGFFVEKIEKIRDGLEKNPLDYPNHLRDSRPQFTGNPLSEFQPVSEDDVAKVIGSSPSTSCCLDPLPTWLLKRCLASLLTVITLLVNLSLQSGEFCSSLKKAYVTPLLKKADLDPDFFKNFRPVSNLSFLSKLIERIVALQITAHLKLNGLLEEFQSAYKSLHSNKTALLRVQNDLLRAVDESGAAILVLLDLSAAFDTIDHGVLLRALQYQFGLVGRVLSWFASYLCGRVQAIKIGQAISQFIELTFGVPQGSVLGPILFTLYTSSLGPIIRRHGLSYHLYADDTQLYIAFKIKDSMPGISKEEAIRRVEACAQDIRSWMTNNYLKLNEDKTELIVFTTPRSASPEVSILIGDDRVEISDDDPKNLGVTYDSHIAMGEHLKKLRKALNSQLFKIGKLRKYLDRKSCSSLINGLFTSRLDQCNSLLYGLPKSSLAPLQKLQNRAARILTYTRKYDHITPVLKSLHWLPVEQRVTFKLLLLTFKALHDLAPSYLSELLTWHEPTAYRLCSGQKRILFKPSYRLKTFGFRRFEYAGPHLGNSLPDTLRHETNLDRFKWGLKIHLFGEAFD